MIKYILLWVLFVGLVCVGVYSVIIYNKQSEENKETNENIRTFNNLIGKECVLTHYTYHNKKILEKILIKDTVVNYNEQEKQVLVTFDNRYMNITEKGKEPKKVYYQYFPKDKKFVLNEPIFELPSDTIKINSYFRGFSLHYYKTDRKTMQNWRIYYDFKVIQK